MCYVLVKFLQSASESSGEVCMPSDESKRIERNVAQLSSLNAGVSAAKPGARSSKESCLQYWPRFACSCPAHSFHCVCIHCASHRLATEFFSHARCLDSVSEQPDAPAWSTRHVNHSRMLVPDPLKGLINWALIPSRQARKRLQLSRLNRDFSGKLSCPSSAIAAHRRTKQPMPQPFPLAVAYQRI